MEEAGQFIGGLKDIPGVKQLYLACDWSFDKAMGLAGKIHPEFEGFLRDHQGAVALGFGVGFSYGGVWLLENVPRKILCWLNKEDSAEKYDKIMSYLEKIGYGINISIPVAIEYFNSGSSDGGGLQGLAENNPVFALGLGGLIIGSTVAALREGNKRQKRKVKKLEYELKQEGLPYSLRGF